MKPKQICGKPVCRMDYCLAQVEEEGDICLRCDKLQYDAICEQMEEQ